MAPYGRLPLDEQAKGRFLARIQASLSAPTSNDVRSKRVFVFSKLYTTSVTFPFVVSIVYSLVLYHLDPVLGQWGKGDALHRLVLMSTTIFNSAIAFVDILVLSSVPNQKVYTLPFGRSNCLKHLGSVHSDHQRHRHLSLIRDLDSLWLSYDRAICVQVL